MDYNQVRIISFHEIIDSSVFLDSSGFLDTSSQRIDPAAGKKLPDRILLARGIYHYIILLYYIIILLYHYMY